MSAVHSGECKTLTLADFSAHEQAWKKFSSIETVQQKSPYLSKKHNTLLMNEQNRLESSPLDDQ